MTASVIGAINAERIQLRSTQTQIAARLDKLDEMEALAADQALPPSMPGSGLPAPPETPVSVVQDIIGWLEENGPATQSQIASGLERTSRSLSSAMIRLRSRANPVIEKIGKAGNQAVVWRLTDKGNHAAPPRRAGESHQEPNLEGRVLGLLQTKCLAHQGIVRELNLGSSQAQGIELTAVLQKLVGEGELERDEEIRVYRAIR